MQEERADLSVIVSALQALSSGLDRRHIAIKVFTNYHVNSGLENTRRLRPSHAPSHMRHPLDGGSWAVRGRGVRDGAFGDGSA